MTKEQVEKLKLGISPIDDKVILTISGGINWINKNTLLVVNIDDESSITNEVKLFLTYYFDIMSIRPGVSSESISGLSQSFNSSNKNDLLLQYAETIFGEDNLKSQMSFYQAKRRW